MSGTDAHCGKLVVSGYHRLRRVIGLAVLVWLVSPLAVAMDWEIEFVDDAFNWMGSSVSIVVDGAGVPHIANGAHRSEIMRYAVKPADEWLIEEVDVYPSGLSASITLDLDGNPCLAYLRSGSLIFARLSGGSWAHETVDAMQFDKKSAICIASDGVLHIAYCNFGDPWNVKHAWKPADNWEISSVDATIASGNGIGMVLDEADTPHLTHWGAPNAGAGPFQRRYSARKGDEWRNYVVDDTGENCNVIHSGIAIDAVGDKHLVYMSNDCYGMSEVKYAVGGTGYWDITIVDSVDRSAGCSVVLDSSGSPHIVYGTRFIGVAGDSELRYAHLDGEGTWVTEVVDADGDVGEFNSLAIDTQDYLHIAYFGGNGVDQWGVLRYARSATPVTGCLGDLDGDNDVDLADLAQLLANYGMTGGAEYEDGDLDGDGDVDLADLATLLSVYGTTCD